MNKIDLLGMLAGALTTIAFLPQLLRVWKRKCARDISGMTFGIFVAGIATWLAYGLLLGSLPIIAANSVTLVLAAAILALKFRYDRMP